MKRESFSLPLLAAVGMFAVVFAGCKAMGKNPDDLTKGGYIDPNFDLTKKHVTFNNPSAIEPRSTIIKIYAEKEVIVEWPNVDASGNPVGAGYWENEIAVGNIPPPIPGKFSPSDPNYHEDEGFMYVDGQPYYCDYAINPLKLPAQVTVKFYVPRFKDWDGNTAPTRPGQQYYDFRGWSTQNSNALRDKITGKLPSDLSGWLALNPGADFPSDVTDYSVFALWDENENALAQKERLQNTLNALANPPAARTTYNDEYVIGNGEFEGDGDAIVRQLTEELHRLVEEADTLMQGELRTAAIEISEKDEEGNNKTEEMQFIVYDFGRMGVVADNIQQIRNDPRFNPDSFLPKAISLSYAVYPDTNPSPSPYQNYSKGKGRVQSVTIAKTGWYEIELWGASGGHTWGKNNLPGLGGKGGHVKGKVMLEEGWVAKFFIGGEGIGTAVAQNKEQNGQILFDKLVPRWPKAGSPNEIDTNHADFPKMNPGGWNGGGSGGKSANAYPGAGSGGGASDVRIVQQNNAAGVYSWDKNIPTTAGGSTSGIAPISNRILVAAGGGGSAQIADVGGQWWPGIRGGWADDVCYTGSYRGPSATSKNSNQLYTSKSGSTTYYYGIPTGMKKTDNEMDLGGNAKASGHKDWGGYDGADHLGNNAAEGTGGGGGGGKGGAAVLNTSTSQSHSVDYTTSGSGGTNAYMPVVVTKTLEEPAADLNDESKDPRVNHVYGSGRARIRYVEAVTGGA